MEKARLVLGLLHSVLGKSKPSTKGNHAFHCPFCKHHKPKLEIDPNTGFFHCWTCEPATKGRNLVSLLKKLHASSEQIQEMKTYFPDGKVEINEKKYAAVQLPKEFVPLNKISTKLAYRHAKAYIGRRGITDIDVIKYNIGYCESGKYANSIIIPSYDKNGQINYFISRSFEKDPARKYNAPSCNKNELIGFEYYINWKIPVILCEGIFDAIALKRNAIPLFGKTIPKSLMMKLVENDVKTVYLALDNDALKEALNYSQQLINLGKDVYLIELQGKDPSDIGFENMTKFLHTAKQLTFGELMLKKMQLK
jgi:DNA primase